MRQEQRPAHLFVRRQAGHLLTSLRAYDRLYTREFCGENRHFDDADYDDILFDKFLEAFYAPVWKAVERFGYHKLGELVAGRPTLWELNRFLEVLKFSPRNARREADAQRSYDEMARLIEDRHPKSITTDGRAFLVAHAVSSVLMVMHDMAQRAYDDQVLADSVR